MVVGGGSYWLHYLVCLVPGLALAASVVTAEQRRRGVGWADPGGRHSALPALAVAATASLVTSHRLPRDARPGPPPDPVITWLRAHDAAPVRRGRGLRPPPDYLDFAASRSPLPPSCGACPCGSATPG